MAKTQIFLIAAALTLTLAACQTKTTDDAKPADPQPASEVAPTQHQEAEPQQPADQVTYQPAYPEEVSTEGLNKEDAAQQEESHSHGGSAHTHGDEGDHTHGEGEDHGGQ